MTWIAVWIAVGMGGVAVAQPLSPPPVAEPSVGATVPAGTTAAPGEDPRPGDALTLCSSGEPAKGVAVLARLYAETRNPSFVFNQARCYQQNGQLDQARERFREYIRVGKSEPPEDIKRAEGFIAEIDQELARRTGLEDARPQQRHYRGALRTTSIVLAATSLAAFGTGAFLSYKVEAKQKDVERDYGKEDPINGTALSNDTSAGTRLETLQYIAYGVGVAALAGAVTTFGLSGWSFRDEPVIVAPVVTPQAYGGVVRMRF